MLWMITFHDSFFETLSSCDKAAIVGESLR
jgi:hypothetical protein